MDGRFKLDNQLCFRLYTASRLITQAYHPYLWEKDAQPVNDIAKRLMLETNTVTPLLKRMEAEGILTRAKGTEDGRQMIVKLTDKGCGMKKKLMCVPEAIGSSVLCETVTPETVPGLYCMLDGIIRQLNEKQTNK